MKKVLMGVAAGAAVVVVYTKAKRHAGGMGEIMSDKMHRCMEELPENAPPRVMFDNLSTTRTNTDKILALLEERPVTDVREALLTS